MSASSSGASGASRSPRLALPAPLGAQWAALRQRWLATCDAVFRAHGKFVEKYNVLDPLAPSTGGEYALQDGFGWSNGVYLDLAD